MLKPGTILKRLYDRLETAAVNRRVAEMRIGLSYVGVHLDNGATGLAALLPDKIITGYTAFKDAGTHVSSSASGMLRYLVEGEDSLHLAMGLALANALIEPSGADNEDREATTTFSFRADEKVTMVGLFSPLVERIRATGAVLTIIEKNAKRQDLLPAADRQKALRECDVAIITATTLLNNTFEETAAALGTPRVAVLMGPSTPMVPGLFLDTPITQLGGALVADSARVLRIISEGGGTPALRPYLRFVNLVVNT